MITLKVIKPGKFNQKALAQLANKVSDFGDDFGKDFSATTKTWKHQVKFAKLDRPKRISTEVSTDDEIYGYVDRGTKAHVIMPKGRRLRFQSGYSAKTSPGVIGSSGGGPSGAVVFARAVRHPGTKPRKFEATIAKKWEPKFAKAMQKALAEAAKDSGHAI